MKHKEIATHWDTLGLINKDTNPFEEFVRYQDYINSIKENPNYEEWVEYVFTLQDFRKYISELQEEKND